VLSGQAASLSVDDLLGGDAPPPRRFRSPAAPDEVWVVELADGGLISYRRADGTFVHTLGTREGFARKLAQLGIVRGEP